MNKTNINNPIIDYVSKKLVNCEKDLNEIKIKVKSVFYSSINRQIDLNKAAIIKLSILPIPGKPITGFKI